MTIANTTSKLLLAVLLASLAVPASASEPSARVPQQGSPKIMVPTPTPAGGVTGCWAADRNLYGYRLSFCVHHHGGATYTVTGNGLHCHARLGWQQAWGSYGFAMRRTSCGQGMDWTADTFNCVLKGGWDNEAFGRMPVPSQRSHLDCTYRPAVSGYRPTSFSAHRA